jgi:hypothetical protein
LRKSGKFVFYTGILSGGITNVWHKYLQRRSE